MLVKPFEKRVPWVTLVEQAIVHNSDQFQIILDYIFL